MDFMEESAVNFSLTATRKVLSESVSNFSQLSPFHTRGAEVAAAGFAIVFSVLGLLGNLVTAFALMKNRKLRGNATTWFVLSLCFSDFLFCSINLPLTASRYIHQAWIFDDFLCRMFPFFFYANFGASLLNITLIAVNRYVLISHYTLYAKVYRPLNVGFMVVFIWTFSFGLLTLPAFDLWGTLGLDPVSFSCTILKKNGTSPKKFLFVFGIIFPCFTIILCYTCIFLKVRNSHRRALNIHQNRPGQNCSGRKPRLTKERRDDIRLTQMMFIIFVTYFISYLPLLVLNVVDDEARRLPGVVHIIASILAWASAVVNPFIYAVSNRQYRQAYLDVLSCCKHEEANKSNNGSRSCSGGKTFLSDAVQFQSKLTEATPVE